MSPRVILTYLWMLLATTSGCFYGAWRNRHNSEEYIPATFFGLSLVLYLGGIARQLTLTVHLLMLLTAAGSLVFLVWMLCRDGFGSLKRLLTPGMVLYGLVFIFLAFTQFKLVSAVPDEASHWMDVLHAMQQTDTFGLAAEGRSYFGTYPPSISLLDFFGVTIGTILTARFMEPLAFLMRYLATLSLFLPFLSRMKTRGWVTVVLGACAFFTLPLMYSHLYFTSLMVDGMVGLLAGFCILYPHLGMESKLHKMTYLLALFVLCLSKGNGVLFALAAVLLYGVICFKNNQSAQDGRHFLAKWGMALAAVGIVLASWLSWKVLTAFHQPLFSQPWQNSFSPGLFKERLYIRYMIVDFFFGATLDVGFVQVPCIAVLLLLLLGVSLMIGRHETLAPRRKPFFWTLAIFCLAYVAGVSTSYLTVFGLWEAETLSSIDRYSYVVWLMLAYLLVMLVFLHLGALDGEQKKRWCTMALAVSVLLFPYAKVNQALLNGATVAGAHEIRDRYDVLVYRVDRAIPDDSAEIFLVSQETGYRDEFWYLRSLIRPHVIDNHNFNLAPEGQLSEEGIPCITMASYEESMAASIAPERWREMLRDGYDYVLLASLSDTFAEDYAAVFEDPSTIAPDSLYQVLPDGLLRHVPIQ